MSRSSEDRGYVTLFEPVDKGASALVSDAVDMSLYNSFTAYLFFGAITGDSVLTVYGDTTSALATALTTAIDRALARLNRWAAAVEAYSVE